DSLFGYDLDIDGVNAIIGAPGSEDFSGNSDRGMAYLYVDGGGGYFPEMVIESSSGQDGAFFGAAVGIQDDLFAIGAPYHSFGTGFVDIYYDVTGGGDWTVFNTILPNTTTVNDSFGFAIDVAASTVYVGSPFGEGLGSDTGCVHGMKYNASGGQFMEEERFYASDLAGTDLGGVGYSIAATNRQLLVGAPYDNGDQGSSLLFASERFWTNPGGGAWADAANWSGGSVPESENPVIFAVPGAFTVDFPVGQAPEIQSLDMLDGFVLFDLVSGGLTCNAANGKGLIVASDGTAALQVSQGFFDVGSNCVIGDSTGSDGLLRLDQVYMNVAETLSIGEQGSGHLSLFNSSTLQADMLTIGNNGGTGLLEAGAGDYMYFDPANQSEYGVGLTDGVIILEDGYIEAGGEGIRIDPEGNLEGYGTVVGDIFNVGELEISPGVPGDGPYSIDLYGTMIMVREETSGDLSKGSLVTSWDGNDQVFLDISNNAYLSGLYRLDVPVVNSVSSGDTFSVLRASTIEEDFECYLVPYVDETTYFRFSRDMRGGATTIEGNVNDLAIPFGFNPMVDGPVITGEARSIEPMDVDGDGDDDLVVLASGADGGDAVCVLLNEDGALCLDSQISVSGNPADMDSGDFDNDGDLDLAVSCLTSNKLQILENTSGSFAVVQTYDTGNKPIALTVFDWDGNNYMDIALINQDDDTLYVYQNSEALRAIAFGTPDSTATSDSPAGIAPGDFDNGGDKEDDIVVAGSDGEITYHHNISGVWGTTEEEDLDESIGGSAAIDLDLDGIDDLLVSLPDSSESAVLYGPSSDITMVTLPLDSSGFTEIDLDDDGDGDAVFDGPNGAGRGTIGVRVLRNDTETDAVVFMDVPAGVLGGSSSLSTGMLVDIDVYPDLLTVGNDDVENEFTVSVQTSVNDPLWAPDKCASGCEGDSDGSGAVDVSDLLNVIGDWGSCGKGDCLGDINGDGDANVSDLLLVIANWGSC
ncbi:MAG: FG-GAP-like repeat-containing protein, partial [Phycisphaerales bacterium]|nr:FG-GAP-like repeat-containing protein [Phycisphaerales bacterium]